MSLASSVTKLQGYVTDLFSDKFRRALSVAVFFRDRTGRGEGDLFVAAFFSDKTPGALSVTLFF